jgi:LPS-assembly protein
MTKRGGRARRAARLIGGLGCCLVLSVALPLRAAQPKVEDDPAPAAAPTTPAAVSSTAPSAAAPAPSAGSPDVTAPAPAAPTVPPPPPRLTFEVKFPPAQGGGTAAGSAGEVEYEKDDLIVARGGVEVRFETTVVKADTVTLDQSNKTLVAQGNVSVTQGPQRLLGDRATYDLGKKTGVFDNATALVTDEYTFRGRTIAKTGEDTYRIEDGSFTSCAGDVPPWSFRLSRADVRVEGYARVRNARMRVKNVPVLYFPYVLWPAKTDRTPGLLIPNIGSSDRKGSYLGLAYYQPWGRSYDATFYADLYSKDYLGLGTEFRYKPSVDTEGTLEAYGVRGPLFDDETGKAIEGTEDERWRVRFDHETRNLPFGLRGVVAYRDFSDFDFFQDFDRDRTQVALRTLYSNAFLAGSWGPHSLNLLVDDRETFLGQAGSVEQRQLPELEYRLRSTRLGKSPLYLKALASASLLDIERSETYAARYSRVDVFPELSLPLRPASWMSIKLTGGGRATSYGDSLCRASTGAGDTGEEICRPGEDQFTGDTLSRNFATAGAEIVGPSLARVFAQEGVERKVKHVIEPRLTYSYLGDFDDRQRIPLFDEVDTENPTNVARFSLVNRVLMKSSDAASAREVLSFELSQAVSFDDELPFQTSSLDGETSDRSPLSAELRVSVSQKTNLRVETLYSDFLGGFVARSISGNVALGQNSFGLTWYTRMNPERDVTTSDQAGFTTSLAIVPKTLRLDAQVNYDIETKELQQQRYFLNWTGSCFGIRLELREFRTALRRDRDYRLAVTLKSVGTFLDLNGGQRDRF